MFALIDCNNFYCSCERLFRPDLAHRPVAVLSNNDGCIIARSNETKALGIPMGAPYFKWKEVIESNGVEVFSSNYQLYGDMSARVMNIIKDYSPDVEIYSIDEAFISLKGFEHHNLTEYCYNMREHILKHTGITVSIGIAPSKTLAKIANHIAKKKIGIGVFHIADKRIWRKSLQDFPIGDIWGVGRRWNEKLQRFGIHTAYDLSQANPAIIRKHFTVVGERMVRELKGISCINLEEVQDKKNIMSSKSFGRVVTDKHEIEEALSNYAARACEKLRLQNGKAQAISVFIRTNPFRESDKQYRGSSARGFVHPTSDTAQIIAAAKSCLNEIYSQGHRYHKCGIMLLDIVPANTCQYDLFTLLGDTKRDTLMGAIDKVNKRYGSQSIGFAAQGHHHPWKLRAERRSPRYTTNWNELLEVR